MTATQDAPTTTSTTAAAPAPTGFSVTFAGWLTSAEKWLLEDKRSLYGLALARILSGGAVLGILATNFRYRSITYGPASTWVEPLQAGIQFPEPRLFAWMGPATFTAAYIFVMVLAVAFILGWRTRLTGPLMLVGWIGIVETNSFLGDQGDNILRIGLICLMFTASAERWSLDARRRRDVPAVPVSWRQPKDALADIWVNVRSSTAVLPTWFTNVVHNLGLAALAFQIIVLYIAAGMFKTQGSLWQHGTAIYYPLQLPQYKPFPFLTDAFSQFGVIVGISTYVAVFVQLFFAPLLLHRIARRFALTFVILFHLAIAVMMALPWFSLAMVAFDAIFVSTATYMALERWAAARGAPVRDLWWDVTDRFVDRFRKGSGARRA